MGDFEADTLRDSIQSAWALTGSLSKTVSGTRKKIVKFYAHKFVKILEQNKAILVRKVTPKENVKHHPDFDEVSDVFEIVSYYKVRAAKDSIFDNAEKDIEDMCEEVIRIITTIYNPQNGTGVFYSTDFNWRNEDDLNEKSQTLSRVLTLTLTRIRSASTKTFQGFGGVLVFDTSASVADSKPGGDHTYVGVHKVQIVEGFDVVEGPVTNDTVNGIGVPILFRGKFRGRFQAEMLLNKDDVVGTTADLMPKIHQAQNNGEHVIAVFLHANSTTEGTPSTLTTSSPVKVTDIEKISEDEDLLKVRVIGRLTKPSTWSVS